MERLPGPAPRQGPAMGCADCRRGPQRRDGGPAPRWRIARGGGTRGPPTVAGAGLPQGWQRRVWPRPDGVAGTVGAGGRPPGVDGGGRMVSPAPGSGLGGAGGGGRLVPVAVAG